MLDRTSGKIEVILDGIAVPKCKQLRYLGSLFQEKGMIDEDVTQRIKNRMVEMEK